MQHSIHPVHVVPGVTPVAFCFHVTQFQHIELAEFYFCEAVGDFSRDKCFATARGFVIEQDAVAGMQAIGFAVVLHDPVAVELGYTEG